MHKKHKLHKLHSIPIGLCNNINRSKRLYLVSYSIPLSLLVVLLLGFTMMVNPDYFASQKSYAIETGKSSESSEEGSNSMARVAPTSTIALNVTSDTNDGYGNDVAGQVTTAPGAGTAYRSHKVKITGSNIMSYDLKISGPTNLTPSNGASTTISGAGGETGSGMTGNTWGYAWGQDSEAVEEMIYNTMSTTGTGLSCDSPSSYNVNCERKLVFGANFGVDANPGTYTAGVTLSLTATPAVVTYTLSYNANGGSNAPTAQTADSSNASHQFTISDKGSMAKTGYNFLGWSTSNSATVADTIYNPGKTVTLQKDNPSLTLYAVWKAITLDAITTMQEMTPMICQNTAIGATKTLKDNRGTSPISYKIIKMNDGTCWMAENLRLINTTIDSTNSDMTSGSFTIPASNASGFSSMSASDGYAAKAYYNNDTVYGAYYNWYTATAGAGTSSVSSGDLSTSICPKGWKLPADSGTGSFYNIISGTNGYKSSWTTVNGKSGYKFGNSSNDAFWPAAGAVNSGSLLNAGSYGYYWSRRAYDASYAYRLYFDSSDVGLQNVDHRYLGYSVRCVAAQ